MRTINIGSYRVESVTLNDHDGRYFSVVVLFQSGRFVKGGREFESDHDLPFNLRASFYDKSEALKFSQAWKKGMFVCLCAGVLDGAVLSQATGDIKS